MEDNTLDNMDMPEAPESFENVYKAYADPIRKFLFWRTKHMQVSEDLTSATFQKAWTSRKSFKGGSIRAWLYRIARNTLFDYWRKTQEIPYENTPELGADDLSIPELLDRSAELDRLRKAVERLSPEMKAIVKLRFIEGMSSREVAEKLNKTDSNVRVIQYRALKHLRDYLK